MQEQSEKSVRITMQNGLPVPDHDPIEVKKDNQKVRWYADFEFKIDVDGYTNLNHANGGGNYRCTTGTFSEIRQYKYSITANGITNDPGLDIKP